MKLDKYPLRSDETYTVFEFVSEGKMGRIVKLIHFQQTSQPALYNLAFGDKIIDEEDFDVLSVSDNGDTEKVLATVVAALYSFFNNNPYASVYATGSSLSRTRLYRRGITKFFDEVQRDFILLGQTLDGLEPFDQWKNYIGFLVQRKF